MSEQGYTTRHRVPLPSVLQRRKRRRPAERNRESCPGKPGDMVGLRRENHHVGRRVCFLPNMSHLFTTLQREYPATATTRAAVRHVVEVKFDPRGDRADAYNIKPPHENDDRGNVTIPAPFDGVQLSRVTYSTFARLS